jgi:hypothetical protein
VAGRARPIPLRDPVRKLIAQERAEKKHGSGVNPLWLQEAPPQFFSAGAYSAVAPALRNSVDRELDPIDGTRHRAVDAGSPVATRGMEPGLLILACAGPLRPNPLESGEGPPMVRPSGASRGCLPNLDRSMIDSENSSAPALTRRR